MTAYHSRYELVDLSQEIYEGMPVFGMHQKTFIMVNQTHEENMKMTGSKTLGFSARNLLISEHGPTHTDAVWEYNPEGPKLDEMDLGMFWGDGICVDLSFVRYPDYIEVADLEKAVTAAKVEIKEGDVFLMYTGHYDRTYAKGDIEGYKSPYTGLSYAAAEWLAKKGVANIGVDASAIDLTPDDLDFSGHWVCGKYGMTNTENLRHLDRLIGKRFLYLGLPLNIREGTGSPIRAVALIEK
ncbi:MAG: cyclase family protein [Sporolactobacillus sp.]